MTAKHWDEATWTIYRVLCSHDLPWFLPQIFLYLPHNFVETLLQHLLTEFANPLTDDDQRRLHKSSKPLLLASVFALKHIATDYLKLVCALGYAQSSLTKTWARHKTTETELDNGWQLVAVGGWRLVAGGGWRLVVVGGWWLVAVGGWWRLAVECSLCIVRPVHAQFVRSRDT